MRPLAKSYLKALYDQLWHESLECIQVQGFAYDPLIDDIQDDRFGITLLVRPDEGVISAVQGFMDRVRAIEPNHHFYPSTDVHITVMSVISCYEGFSLDGINKQDYIELIAPCLEGIKPFDMRFEGITLSPSCVMIQGFPSNNALDQLRDRLRAVFKNSPLEQSMDSRYPLETFHSTVIRFKEKVRKKEEILSLLENFRSFDFGASPVKEMELVFNDWYQREKSVKKLFVFDLS